MVITLSAIGVLAYIHNKSYLFDGCVVAISIIEFMLLGSGSGSSGSSLSAVRVLRLFRLVRLLKSWQTMINLLKTIAASLGDLGYFSLLLFLFLFVMALAGVAIFRDKMIFNGVRSRNHFDSFGWALVTCFQVCFRLLHDFDFQNSLTLSTLVSDCLFHVDHF